MKKVSRIIFMCLAAVVCILAAGAFDVSMAATFTVNTIADGVDATPGNGVCATAGGVCTLRAAIQEANSALVTPNTIILPAGTYTLTLLGANEDAAASGDLDITSPIDLTGAGERTTIINATGLGDRVFQTFAAAALVNIRGVTIRGGNVTGNGGGILNGGTIVNLAHVIVVGNVASGEGGGIDNSGLVNLTDVTLSVNTGVAGGGGLNNGATGTVNMNRVTINGNTDRGINNSGILTMTNVTISANSTVGGGGGINNKAGAAATLTNATIANNTAGVGGGAGIENAGTVNIRTSIIANNTPLNCLGALTSQGQNLESTNDCGFVALAGDLINTNPLLAGLANNGGPTQTHALPPASPAVDSADIVNCAVTDQRRVVRPQDADGNKVARCDRGAFEFKKDRIGTFRPTTTAWFLDYNGNRAWNACFADTCESFGLSTDVPVTGDWGGLGRTTVGVFRSSTKTWFLDFNDNGVWEGPVIDRQFAFGQPTDTPVAGDWNGDGKTKIGVFRLSTKTWFLDFNGNGVWEGPVIDRQFAFGQPTDTPVAGDWNGDGKTKIGVFRPGTKTWFLDFNGNGVWEGPVTDRQFAFGQPTDIPVTGDWNGDGKTKIGVFRAGVTTWFLDLNGNGVWDGPAVDLQALFGLATDRPVTGNWLP